MNGENMTTNENPWDTGMKSHGLFVYSFTFLGLSGSKKMGTQSDTVWVIMFQVPMAIGHPMPFHGSISCVLQASPNR
jgi:hypothetical protein